MTPTDNIEQDTRKEDSDRSLSERLHTRLLTRRQLAFVNAWTGNLVAAARAAGYKDPRVAAYKLMQDKRVVSALQFKQRTMVEESGEQLARTLPLCRADVIDRLWQLAKLDPERTNRNIGGQVKAAQALEEIFAVTLDHYHSLKRQLEGKTEVEVEFFAVHGYLPHPQQEPAAATQELPQPTEVAATGSAPLPEPTIEAATLQTA